MPEKQFITYQADVTSFELHEAMLGILEPGRYRGYDTITGISNSGSQMSFNIGHNATGIVKTLKNGSLDSASTGVVVTKQGQIIHNNSSVAISFNKNLDSNPVIYLIALKHQYVEQEGSNQSLIEVFMGTPSSSPVLPTISVTPELYTPIGIIYAIGNAGSSYTNYTYYPYTPSLPGALNKSLPANSLLGIDNNNRLASFIFGNGPSNIPNIISLLQGNRLLRTDDEGSLQTLGGNYELGNLAFLVENTGAPLQNIDPAFQFDLTVTVNNNNTWFDVDFSSAVPLGTRFVLFNLNCQNSDDVRFNGIIAKKGETNIMKGFSFNVPPSSYMYPSIGSYPFANIGMGVIALNSSRVAQIMIRHGSAPSLVNFLINILGWI